MVVSSLLAMAYLAAILPPQPAYAHAELVRSSPGNGEQVVTPPSVVSINYSESVQLGEVTVVDGSSQRVDAGAMEIDSSDRSKVQIPLIEIGDGVYTVSWQVLSEDGHSTKGSFFFIVGKESPSLQSFRTLLSATQGQGVDVSPIEPPLRGLLFLTLVVLVGVPITLILIVNPVIRSNGIVEGDLWQRVRLLLIATAIVLIVVTTVLAMRQALTVYSSVSGENLWGFITGTVSGKFWALRTLFGVGLIGVLVLTSFRPLWWLFCIATGIAVLVTISLTSHTASIVQDDFSTLADVGHLVGTALWAGGLVVLAFLLPGLLKRQPKEKEARIAAAVIRRFSAIGLAGLTLAAATGLVLASFHVPGWEALASTLYGASLSLKVGLVAAAIGLGALVRLVLLRRLTVLSGRPPAGTVRWIRLELAFVLGALLLTGVMTSAPTANFVESQETEQEILPFVDRVRDFDVRMTITPEQIGLNVFDVSFLRDGQPIQDVENPVIFLRLPEEGLQLPQTALEPTEPGVNSTLSSFTLPGKWRIRVSADIAGRFAAATFETEVLPSKPKDEDADVTEPETGVAVAGVFRRLLIWGAIGVGIVGAMALIYELYWYRAGRNGQSGFSG